MAFVLGAMSAVPQSARADRSSVGARGVPLDGVVGDAAVKSADGIAVGSMRLESVIVLSGAGIGGLSGLSLGRDGADMTAIADTGTVWRGRLTRDAKGRLNGVESFRSSDLFAGDPAGTHAGKMERDSEEIVAVPGGGWLVGLERRHRVLFFDGPDIGGGAPTGVPTPEAMASLPENGGVEAMTVLSDGRVLMIEEGANDDEPLRHLWISVPIDGGAGVKAIRSAADWTELRYERAPGYRPTSATTTPEGDVLVLERHYSPLAGPGARIVRIDAAAIAPGAIGPSTVARGRELGRLTPPLPVDNFEGIAARRRGGANGDGRLEVIILSDDNFNPLQSTLLMQLSVP